MAESDGVGSGSWTEELASLVDAGIRYPGDPVDSSGSLFETKSGFVSDEASETESLKDQLKGFAKAWGEMLLELGRGCKDIVQQNLLTEDSYVVRKFGGSAAKVSSRLSFLNEYLPEDRDPVHAWPVIISVFIFALAVLSVNTGRDTVTPPVKKVRIHPPSANHLILPDGRRMAYLERGVNADSARFTLVVPHSFLSSRLAGIPGIELSLLEEFGIRLMTYDLPGFGESDPHPVRNLKSSAHDMLALADAVNVSDKFWVMGYSTGAIHAWAALRYIPNRIAGAVMFAPMVNPYDPSMSREESQKTWECWTRRKKYMHFLARRFPRFLSYFYRRTFLSGRHGPIDKWLSLSLAKRDRALTEEPNFEEFWHRDVEESIRQGNARPFIEEAVLQVSDWGFSLADLRVQKKCWRKGILPWLMSMYNQAECELEGFLGPIHVWQGMDDLVVPPSITDFVSRSLPEAKVHKIPGEGHFSPFFFCHECHRRLFSTLFGTPQGPLDKDSETDQTSNESDMEEKPASRNSTAE